MDNKNKGKTFYAFVFVFEGLFEALWNNK